MRWVSPLLLLPMTHRLDCRGSASNSFGDSSSELLMDVLICINATIRIKTSIRINVTIRINVIGRINAIHNVGSIIRINAIINYGCHLH